FQLRHQMDAEEISSEELQKIAEPSSVIGAEEEEEKDMPVVICHRCGAPTKGWFRKMRLKGGLVKEYPYYRCTRNGCQAYKAKSKEEDKDKPPCHRCGTRMKECIRKQRYNGLIKEFPSYRCTREGCRAFKPMRVVKQPEVACVPHVTEQPEQSSGESATQSDKPVVSCHRCGMGRMKEIVRKVRHPGGLIREYPCYRCTRHGCQAYKAKPKMEPKVEQPEKSPGVNSPQSDLSGVFCHRCEAPMKECVRKRLCNGIIKEYPSYRCTRAGCRALKSLRVLEHPELARELAPGRSTTESVVEEESPSIVPVVEMPVDPDEPVYCICQQVSMDEMICCENPDCSVEWYHLQCVGMREGPPPGVRWFCESCRDSFKHILNQWNYEANEPPPKVK
ncbi:hypothetical protein PMAYCL1PPCAC_31538, partial [Pristionchus mayeri]